MYIIRRMTMNIMSELTAQQENSMDFLKEWAFHRAMITPIVEEDGIPDEKYADSEEIRKKISSQITPRNPRIQSGQIRLLMGYEEPINILILGSAGAGMFITVPFSPFANPANDEEYLLGGNRPSYLQVLQIWLTGNINGLLLQNSWLIDTLTSEELAGVYEPASERRGSEITHQGDPRLDYRQLEFKKLAELHGRDMTLTDLLDAAILDGMVVRGNNIVTTANTFDVLAGNYQPVATRTETPHADVLFLLDKKLVGYGYTDENGNLVFSNWLDEKLHTFNNTIVCKPKR